jgi:hypothetical protein
MGPSPVGMRAIDRPIDWATPSLDKASTLAAPARLTAPAIAVVARCSDRHRHVASRSLTMQYSGTPASLAGIPTGSTAGRALRRHT